MSAYGDKPFAMNHVSYHHNPPSNYMEIEMTSTSMIDFLGGRITTFEEFFKEENLTEFLDFGMILDAISSIPLYERLGVKEESLSVDELAKMNHEALCYKRKCEENRKEKYEFEDTKETKGLLLDEAANSIDENEFLDVNNLSDAKEFSKDTNDANEDNDSSERFLKYLYSPKENDILVATLQKNMKFDIFPKLPEEVVHEGKTDDMLKEMKEYLQDVSSGKYDDFAFRHPSPIPSSSGSESDEECSSKAREFSLKFRVSEKAYKYDFLKDIVDDSLKTRETPSYENDAVHAQPPKWISSDDDSEAEQQYRKNELEAKRRKRRIAKNKCRSGTQTKQNNATSLNQNSSAQLKHNNISHEMHSKTDEFQSKCSKDKDTEKGSNSMMEGYRVSLNKHDGAKPSNNNLPSNSKSIKFSPKAPSPDIRHDSTKSSASHLASNCDKTIKKRTSNSKPNENACVGAHSSNIDKNTNLNIMSNKKFQDMKNTALKGNQKRIQANNNQKLKKNTTVNAAFEEQTKNSKPLESSGNFKEATRATAVKNDGNKNETHENSVRNKLPSDSRELASKCSTMSLKTNESHVEPRKSSTSSSSDEDWSKLAGKSLSTVDKILKKS